HGSRGPERNHGETVGGMSVRAVHAPDDTLRSFRAAGRTLFSLGLVNGTEGNLSVYDGRALVITRTGAALGSLTEGDLITVPFEGDGATDSALASSDLDVHRKTYRSRGHGAIVHAHPSGSVPEGGGKPGAHGVYVFGPSLEQAVEDAVRQARSDREEHDSAGGADTTSA